MRIEKTIKLKIIPITKEDRALLLSLLNDYTKMIRESLEIIMENNVCSRKRAHELCYKPLRERYPFFHNKFAQEAYKRALSMYRSYRKLLSKWNRLPEKLKRRASPPSPPSVEENRVIDLHIDTFRLKREHGFLVLTISKEKGCYLKFIVKEYKYAIENLQNADIGNSKILIDGDEIYLLLTSRKRVLVEEHRNKLFVDINEDSVDCLLVNYEEKKAYLFSIKHDIRKIRINYRRIRKSIQKEIRDEKRRNRLLAKYGKRERNRVESRIKNIVASLVKLAEKFRADLVREDLRDLRNGKKTRSRQLNHRLSTLPYKKFTAFLDYKSHEHGLKARKIDPRRTSITCPLCGHVSKRNRVSKEEFICENCGFKFNAQYIACLNMFSRLNDGEIAIRGGRIILISRKAGFVVAVNVAPDGPRNLMKWLREKPTPIAKASVVAQI